MKRPEILDKADNPNLIPGIYNYCDRWCERCSFTDRCLNYESNEERFSKQDNENFWEEIHDVFQETKDLLEYIAEQEGIDLDNLPVDHEWEEKRKKQEDHARNHVLSKAAEKYADTVDQWFERNAKVFEEKEAALNNNHSLGIQQKESEKQALQITDSLEVIRWYQLQIYVKLMRALSNDDPEGEDDEEIQTDANGSAKVALLGIDRSLAAWGNLQNQFDEHADDILDILVFLEKLKRKTEQTFPKARDFIRPGFDERDTR